MSHAPPPLQMHNAYADVPPSRTSALAIVSLVTGILGCLLVTPFVAVVTGILGIRATRDPLVRGRGMAVAGLVLGLVWLLAGVAGGAGAYAVWRNSEAPATVARKFTADLIAGDFPAALAASRGLSEPTLRVLHGRIRPWGANTDITFSSRAAQKPPGGGATRWTLAGSAEFARAGTKRVFYVLEAKPGGGYEVVDVGFE